MESHRILNCILNWRYLVKPHSIWLYNDNGSDFFVIFADTIEYPTMELIIIIIINIIKFWSITRKMSGIKFFIIIIFMMIVIITNFISFCRISIKLSDIKFFIIIIIIILIKVIIISIIKISGITMNIFATRFLIIIAIIIIIIITVIIAIIITIIYITKAFLAGVANVFVQLHDSISSSVNGNISFLSYVIIAVTCFLKSAIVTCCIVYLFVFIVEHSSGLSSHVWNFSSTNSMSVGMESFKIYYLDYISRCFYLRHALSCDNSHDLCILFPVI